jgi:hypothetical protein
MTEAVPKLTKIALLLNPISPQADLEVQEMQEPTRSLGLQLFIAKASPANELDAAFAAIKESGAGALIVAVDPLFVSRREKIVALGFAECDPWFFRRTRICDCRRLDELCGELFRRPRFSSQCLENSLRPKVRDASAKDAVWRPLA